jgi:hypothetical protein
MPTLHPDASGRRDRVRGVEAEAAIRAEEEQQSEARPGPLGRSERPRAPYHLRHQSSEAAVRSSLTA